MAGHGQYFLIELVVSPNAVVKGAAIKDWYPPASALI
jgi:hypothetical protein